MPDLETPAASSDPTPAVETEVSTSAETAAPAGTASSKDRSATEKAIGSKFNNVFKDADDDAVEEKPVTETTDPATGEVKVTSTETPEAATTEQAPKPTPSATPAAQVIPAAYSRSLKAYGWTEEEIKDAYKADPANFLRTAAKFHENRNEETRRMSDLGRLAKQQAEAQPAQPAATATFDIAALKKTYGEKEPFIAQLEILNKQLESQQTWVQKSQEAQRKAEMDTLGRQIDGFFSGKDLADYAEAYGTATKDLKPEQMASRQKVLETADLLIRGAKVSGKQLSLEDALTMAHDSVSGPVKTQAVRKQIVEQAKTRNAAISLRPGSRSSANGGENPRKALEGAVGKSLASVFKS